VTSKAVKTAKPVKKTAQKADRARGPTTKKLVAKTTKTGMPVKTSAKAVVKKAVKKVAVKPVAKPVPVKASVSKPHAHKTNAVKPKATPASQSTAKPKPVIDKPKSKVARVHGKTTNTTRAPSTASRSIQMSERRPASMAHTVAIKKDPRLANNWKTKPIEQWTDAEVISMPDEEYMNDKQLAFFRLKLLQLKNDILTNAGETTEHLRSDTVVVPDPADRATIEEEHALELRTRDRERKLLRKIEQSIARIDAGDYGYCDETGEPIGVARLLARPTATLSLEAQQRRELKQKMFGD